MRPIPKSGRMAAVAAVAGIWMMLALPAAAPAAVNAKKLAADACKVELKQDGRKAFEKNYGTTRSMRKCVKRATRAVRRATQVAIADCNEELVEFGVAEFLVEYGSTDLNLAFAECVEYGIELELDDEFEVSGDEDDAGTEPA